MRGQVVNRSGWYHSDLPSRICQQLEVHHRSAEGAHGISQDIDLHSGPRTLGERSDKPRGDLSPLKNIRLYVNAVLRGLNRRKLGDVEVIAVCQHLEMAGTISLRPGQRLKRAAEMVGSEIFGSGP